MTAEDRDKIMSTIGRREAEIIEKFFVRYADRYHSDSGTFKFLSAENIVREGISHYTICMCFSDDVVDNVYRLFVWLDDADILHVTNEKFEDVTLFAEENGWSEDDVRHIKYGE